MDKNVAYSETPWPLILPVYCIWLLLIIAGIYFKGLEFRTYLAVAILFVGSCYIFLLYWRYAIQIDDTTIALGYHFTGKEKVLLNTIEYAEILVFGRTKLIRLRLNGEYLTRYKLKRGKKIKELVFRSRNPESVLSVLSEKGVPVQRMQRRGTE